MLATVCVPLMISPLSAAGENVQLKPAGVYKYRSGIVRRSARSGFIVSYSQVEVGIGLRVDVFLFSRCLGRPGLLKPRGNSKVSE